MRRAAVMGLGVVAIVISAIVPLARAQDAEQSAEGASIASRVDKIFEKWDKPNSPGCAIAVIQDDHIVYKRGYGMTNLDHEVPQWSPDGSALLLFDFDSQDTAVATLVPLKDEPKTLERFPTAPTFLRWRADGSIVFVQNNMLWQAQFQSDRGMVGEPMPWANSPTSSPAERRPGSTGRAFAYPCPMSFMVATTSWERLKVRRAF